jgi:hypothetical protein
MCSTQTPSSGRQKLPRQNRMNSQAKLSTSTTPSQGWIARVASPPPNSAVRKNSAGEYRLSPEMISRTMAVAVSQWLMRADSE